MFSITILFSGKQCLTQLKSIMTPYIVKLSSKIILSYLDDNNTAVSCQRLSVSHNEFSYFLNSRRGKHFQVSSRHNVKINIHNCIFAACRRNAVEQLYDTLSMNFPYE